MTIACTAVFGYRDSDYYEDAARARYGYDNRSRWEKSRDKITRRLEQERRAAVGGLIGGKKGAIIGAICWRWWRSGLHL